jgi:hypothetical protein
MTSSGHLADGERVADGGLWKNLWKNSMNLGFACEKSSTSRAKHQGIPQ